MKFSKIKYMPQKFFKLKLFLTIIAVVLVFVQICLIANAFAPLTTGFRKVTVDEIETVPTDEIVQGFVGGDRVVMQYTEEIGSGDSTSFAIVLTENRKLVLIGATASGAPASAAAISELKHSAANTLNFKGRVKPLKQISIDSLKLNLLMNNIYHRYGVDDTDIIGNTVICSDDQADRWTAILISSIAVLIILIAAIWFLQRKSINNLIYGILVNKGVISPELKVTKDDIAFDNTETYKGIENDADSFYVNTDYELTETDRTQYKFVPENDNTVSDSLLGKALSTTGLYSQKKEPPEEAPPTEFYQSSVNDDGYFYIVGNKDDDTDEDGEKKMKY